MLSRSPCIRAMTPRVALTTLGLTASRPSDISHATVKKAYLTQTLRCHPDLHPEDPEATNKFRSLSEALRVALKSLEMKAPSGAAGRNSSLDDAQSVLDALRQAIVAYHRQRDATCNNNNNNGRRSHGEEDVDLFSSYSLEYVSSVCQTEALAMQRVKKFCDELPEVLCGKSCVLFEAVAFFNARYVEAMSRCVLRFSKNLPIIVNRVVKGRKKFIRYARNKANSGVGTGSRPCQQKIEDMAMKPLVLVGVLLFNHEKNTKTKMSSSSSHNSENSKMPPDSQDEVKSTCGAVSEESIKICEELRCTIYPSDSIGDITEKIGRWEAASFERLQLELAMVDTTSLLSSMLDLNEHTLSVMHHLHLPKKVSERVSLTLQKLACSLCYHCDETSHETQVAHNKNNNNDEEEEEEANWEQISDGIRRCQHLARVTSPYIEGNISLIWDNDTPLVETTEEVAAGNEDDVLFKRSEENDTNKGFLVNRHMSCCTAEMMKFSVAIKLSKETGEFLDHLINAMERVLREANLAISLLPELLEVREKVVNEEFIPKEISPTKEEEEVEKKEDEKENGVCNSSGMGKGGHGDVPVEPMLNSCNYINDPVKESLCEDEIGKETEQEIQYCYRGPIHCFPRIFSMNPAQELNFWQMLHQNRVYLAQHAPAMNPINVYYNCLPYKPHPHAMHSDKISSNDELIGGWIGEAEDGAENAIITHTELESHSAFRQWLEDVVEQSSLNRECHRIADEAGVGYVMRDPTLPLPQYLSFVKVFCAATGVRGILENKAGKTRTVTPEDIGLAIIVGTECDVCDGGRLLVPWWMDPSILLALLQDGTEGKRATLIEDGREASSG